jgi:soluble lytic murein transglycosylase-like protein
MFCAAIAVVGGYSCAQAQTKRGTDDQTALAVPRIALNGSPGVAMPQPLSPGEAARVRHIFALQAGGAIQEAVRETALLDNKLLLGSILADRYLGEWGHPTATDLTDWLASYGDQPDAPAIRALRARLQPEIPPVLAQRLQGQRPQAQLPGPHAGKTASALPVRTLFVQNRDAAAMAAAAALLSRTPSSGSSGEPLFAGGLAAWRSGGVAEALDFFEAAYRSAPSAALRAAGAYWAARAARRQADRSASIVWLRRAAQETDTFYGRIAGRALGPTLACPGETIGTADIDALAATPEGRRAFALLQVGEKRRAEAELRALWADAGQSATFARPLALLARAVGLNQFAAELGSARLSAPRPAQPPTLHPAGGFVIDPSLIYALVHHESNFSPAAVSHSGASGLMQIKPATARGVGGDTALAGLHVDRLHDPAVNLAVGQHYLLQLSQDESIDGDLVRLLAGYSQGLFGLKRWADSVNAPNDPLLFLEAIPNPATRMFIQDILAWSWHYAAVFGLPAASLDALASGHFPHLVGIAAQPMDIAEAVCGGMAALP